MLYTATTVMQNSQLHHIQMLEVGEQRALWGPILKRRQRVISLLSLAHTWTQCAVCIAWEDSSPAIHLLSEPSSQKNPQGKLQLIPFLNENSPNPCVLPGCLCVSAPFIPVREVSWVPWPSLSCNEIPPVLSLRDLICFVPVPVLSARCANCLDYCGWCQLTLTALNIAISRGPEALRQSLKYWLPVLLACLQEDPMEKGRNFTA